MSLLFENAHRAVLDSLWIVYSDATTSITEIRHLLGFKYVARRLGTCFSALHSIA